MKYSMSRIGCSTDNMIFGTIKDEKVSSMINTSLVRHLGRLLANYSWPFFGKIAFASHLYEDIMKLEATEKIISKQKQQCLSGYNGIIVQNYKFKWFGLRYCTRVIAGLKCLKFPDFSKNPIKLLQNFTNELYNLQTLYIDISLQLDLKKVEAEIGQLSSLQKLPLLELRRKGYELGRLHHISRMLPIKGLELVNNKKEVKKAGQSMKTRKGSYGDQIYDAEVLDGLQPNLYLRILSIQGYAAKRFPTCCIRIALLHNLIKTQISYWERCQQLPTLGKLPHLKNLHIKGIESLKQIDAEFSGCVDICEKNEVLAIEFRVWGIKIFSSHETASDKDSLT
ncbi:hypothetical protein Cgig2_011899 [Carnegiea gigantea]|uniref:R13L1/DRL21-like LRR repeat region domain-containing protein n=1 Tax=Carnegiea gigantea TaxID=171969 RepID=A0A9Q1Q651_9CARY|nr:hypothetical protein Cgig2_011899 [Carnegiea gigantea]